MADAHGTDALARAWREAQAAFWQAALTRPAFADPEAFAAPDWQAFDGLVAHLIGTAAPAGSGPVWQEAAAAATACRDIVGAAWARVQAAFETHRRAIHDTAGPPPDWRVLRDRWFQIAEAEFIRTQRSAPFLAAQRRAVRAAAGLWAEVPEAVRHTLRDQRLAAETGRQTLERLGVELVAIAQTPKQTIWKKGRTTLSRYRPLDGRAPRLGPVLICHGLVGRQTMTDLRPERSLVRNLLAAGVDVFVIDWGNPGPEDAGLGLDHYAGTELVACVEAALAAAAAERLVLFGICQGGTFAACHAARFGERLSGLVLAVAPVDFHADLHDADPAHGILNLWVRSLEEDDIDALIAIEGNVPGTFLGAVFNQLNPVRTLAKYSIEMVNATADPAALTTFLAMEKWLADRPDLPGALARNLLVELYRDNALVTGQLGLAGGPVRLGDIAVPVLNIFATGDHIVPPPCSRALAAHLAPGQVDELALSTGHIGAFVSARSQTLLGPGIAEWLARHTSSQASR